MHFHFCIFILIISILWIYKNVFIHYTAIEQFGCFLFCTIMTIFASFSEHVYIYISDRYILGVTLSFNENRQWIFPKVIKKFTFQPTFYVSSSSSTFSPKHCINSLLFHFAIVWLCITIVLWISTMVNEVMHVFKPFSFFDVCVVKLQFKSLGHFSICLSFIYFLLICRSSSYIFNIIPLTDI